jgi:hypothetical protein
MMSALLAWQLWDVTPARWCAIAQNGTPDLQTACVTVLLKLLELKNNVVIGLLTIVGLSVLSLAAVALGVRLGLTGPGGLTANIEAEQTTVSDGSSTVVVPTPPSEGIKS